jgi:hypothetical protein
LLQLVEERVKPDRDRQKDHGPGAHGKKYWWQYALRSDPLYEAIQQLSSCIVTARTTAHLAFSMQPIDQVFPESTVVIAFDKFSAFACLQSQVHNIWALCLSTYMGQTLRYSVSEAFQTFPFPHEFLTSLALENVGKGTYLHRSEIMRKNDEGLTKTYNHFHDPFKSDKGILELRNLHRLMDIAVLRAYGWDDLADKAEQAEYYQFLLEQEESEDDPAFDSSNSRQRKRHWRYRWPDEFRDEVLGRLLELNEKRHKEEVLAGITPQTSRKSSDEEKELSDDEDAKPAKATKLKQSRQSKKAQKSDNPNQPKLEFDP